MPTLMLTPQQHDLNIFMKRPTQNTAGHEVGERGYFLIYSIAVPNEQGLPGK